MQRRGPIFRVQVMVLCLFVLLGHAADARSNQETPQAPARASEPLVKALEEFKAAVLVKIDSDVETTARAFWDAYNIQQSRKVADFVLAPLTVIEQAIGTVSFAKNIPEIFTGIDRAENILQVVSLFMGLGQLNQVGQNLQVAIDGPAYSSVVRQMLVEAGASSQPGEYATTVKLYLYGIGGKKSPVGVPHRPVDGDEPKAEVLWGAEGVKRRISEDIAKLIKELEAKPVGAGVQVEAIRTHLSTLTQALKRSRADNVTVASAAVLPEADSPPNLVLGSIGALEQVRLEALTHYDNDLRLEQVSVLTSAVKAGTQVISVKVGYKTPGGKLFKEVQRDIITPGAVLVSTLAKTYATGARYQVADLPHEMVLSLPGELANTWKVVGEVVAAIRSLARAPDVTAGSNVQEALSRSGPEALPALIQALSDKDAEVQRKAAEALGEIRAGARDAIPALTEASKSRNSEVQLAARKALRRIKFPSSPADSCRGELGKGWGGVLASNRYVRPCPVEGDEEKKAAADKLNVAFTRKHGVQESVACEALSRNPFAYEGKVVALNVTFQQMIARDRGLFGCGVAVSGIPQGVFSSREVEVVLAGRVLGNTEVKIGPATLQVPHLQYVGVHICKERDCADFFGPASMR